MNPDDYFEISDWYLLTESQQYSFLCYTKFMGIDEDFLTRVSNKQRESEFVDNRVIVYDNMSGVNELCITHRSDSYLRERITLEELKRLAVLGEVTGVLDEPR